MKKISTSIAIASTALLQACNEEAPSGQSSEETEENKTHPELVGHWRSLCLEVPEAQTMSARQFASMTRASGGSGGGSGGIDGDYFKEEIEFRQNGEMVSAKTYFQDSQCNPNSSGNTVWQQSAYFPKDSVMMNDGATAVELDLNDDGTFTYTAFRVSGIDLYLGDEGFSTDGRDGSSSDKRLDGVGSRFTKFQ